MSSSPTLKALVFMLPKNFNCLVWFENYWRFSIYLTLLFKSENFIKCIMLCKTLSDYSLGIVLTQLYLACSKSEFLYDFCK